MGYWCFNEVIEYHRKCITGYLPFSLCLLTCLGVAAKMDSKSIHETLPSPALPGISMSPTGHVYSLRLVIPGGNKTVGGSNPEAQSPSTNNLECERKKGS